MLPVRRGSRKFQSVDNSAVAVNVTSGSAPIPPPSYSSSVHNDPTAVTPGQQTVLNDVRDHEPNKSATGASTQPVTSIPMAQPGMMSAPQPITHQPNPNFPASQNPIIPSLSWLPKPPPGDTQVDCPPGLERLSQLHQIVIVPSVEAQTVYQPGSQNKYLIKNNAGQVIFYAVEDNSTMRTNLYGYETAEISLFDSNNNQVLHFSRILANMTGCCVYAPLYNVDVYCPPGNKIGSVVERSMYYSLHEVTDANDNYQLLMRGQQPCCRFCPCGCFETELIDIQLLSNNKVVGRLFRPVPGVGNPLMAAEISFPKDLNVGVKASLIGFGVTMDAIIIERLKRRQHGGYRG